jgi:glycosyltransferase involved in cell wall biosynthesis
MNSRLTPRISVVIPTRERCDTLVSTLQTCVDQDYDNCEIIVSDNFSQDETRAVVNAVRDPRVRYINTERRLSMSHNWEFALSHVRGDYVTYVGDDDGLLPGALSALAAIVRNTGAAAISWNFASYYWPNCIHTASRNLLLVPCKDQLQRRSGPQMLRQALEFKQGYEQLPYFYKGLISTDLVNRVRESSGGTFFHSMVPDMYSAIALSVFAEEYYYSFRPYSINGTSAASAGAAHFTPSLNASPAKEFLSESNIPFHSDLAFAPSLSIGIAESFFQVRDRIAEARQYSLNIDHMLEAAIREAASAEKERYSNVADALRLIAAKFGLSERLDLLLRAYPNRPKTVIVGLEEGYNVLSRVQIINCGKLGIRNVHQAANLCAAVLSAKEIGFVRNPASVVKTTAALAKGLLTRKLSDWKKSIED